MNDLTPPRIFISYSHDSDEHRQRVLTLAQELRRNGIDAVIDRFVPHPKEGWPRWMQHQIEDAHFVLAVCTATYKRRFDGREDQGRGHGVNWEGLLTAQLIYENQALNERVIPVVFDAQDEANIPLVLRGSTRYCLPDAFNALLRHLTGQPEVVPAPIGQTPYMPPMLPPLQDAPVQSAGVSTTVDKDTTNDAAHNDHQAALNLLCAALETKYHDISHRYTPLEVRKDLRVCPWEPRFILRNPVKRQTDEKAEPVTLDYVETVISTHRLVILGEPGCGKSTGLYAAAHKMSTSRLEKFIDRVPVIINLNRYADAEFRHPRDLLVEMVLDECNRALRETELRLQTPAIEDDLRAGRLHVLFDGLNEVPAGLRGRCIQALVDFCDEFERCNVTITSRKYMYNGELLHTTMEVLELGREEIVGFVERHANDGGITAQAILGVVDKTKWHLFQNPLALHMMVRVFQETGRIPGNRAVLIGSYVELVLDRHISNISRAGAQGVSKAAVKKGLISLSELMSARGLCLPSDHIEQHLRATGPESERTDAILAVALEAGLLVSEGGALRFWHHSIQEYFFVLGFYSRWKGYLGNERAVRRHVRKTLKRIEKWETISLAAGLMTEEEAEVFLKQCATKDEYLTAMVLNHCSGTEAALSTQKRILNRAKVVSLLSYWLGSALEWRLAVRVIYMLLVLKRLVHVSGYAFQKTSDISLPLLGPWNTVILLQLAMCIAVVIVLRRLSDYLVFVRFNTIIRALQHIGSPETRSELMRVFKKFSASALLELSYHTVISRVVASNICTQDELFEGLNREEEKLYCLTTLASVAEPTAMPVVCNVIHSEQNKYALEAAVDCVVSIANKFPQCKDDERYQSALRHAALNRRLPIQARLKAYAHFIEASGTAEEIPYPRLRWLERLERALLSPRWAGYYLMTALAALMFSQTGALAVLVALLSPHDFGNFSGKQLIKLIVVMSMFILIPYLLSKVDLHLQRRIKGKADRKWLSLGETTSVVSYAVPAGKISARLSEIKHGETQSVWQGTCTTGALHKVVSYGLRHGYAVDYLQSDKVSLRLALRSDKAKSQVSPFYPIFLSFNLFFNFVFIYWFLTEIDLSHTVLLTMLSLVICIQFAELVVWLCTNPYISLVVSQTDQYLEVDGEVCSGARRIPVSEVNDAHRIMGEVIVEAGGNREAEQQPVVIWRTDQEKREYPGYVEEVCSHVYNLLKKLELRGESADERYYIRAVAGYLEESTEWEVELWPRYSDGTPDILVAGQLALDFMTNPNKNDRILCIERCVRFSGRWVTWVILLDTPEDNVEHLKKLLAAKNLEEVTVWNFHST